VRPAVVPADLVRVAGVVSFGWALAEGQWVNAALFSLVLLGLMLPRLLGTATVPDVGYGVVVLFAAWSAVLDWYVRFSWLDVVAHVVTGGLTAVLARRVLVRARLLPSAHEPALGRPRAGAVVSTVAVGTSLGVLWEIGEWFGHTYLDRRIQVGYGDTVSDLAADLLGALAAGLVVAASARPRSGSPSDRRAARPTVSVVVPVRDDAEELDHCLGLLARQTLPPLEVVVVDNGSTDHSAEVAVRHGARVVVEPARGIPAAAAAGYDATRGEVIARCDADTRPPADWLETITSAFAERPDLDALTGRGRFHDVPRLLAPVVAGAYLGGYYLLVHLALGHTTLWGSNMAIRRRVWLEVRDLVHRDDPEIHDDIDLAFALGPRRRVRYDRRLLVDVSGRSVRGRRQLSRRMQRAVRTLRRNWAVIPPWTRWWTRWRTRLEAARPGLRHLSH
jgi:Glycosyl transferase family 2